MRRNLLNDLCFSIRLNDDVSVQKVAFHPGAIRENQLIVLSTDGAINLYSVTENSSRLVNTIKIGTVPEACFTFLRYSVNQTYLV
jgi:hypothetical protein